MQIKKFLEKVYENLVIEEAYLKYKVQYKFGIPENPLQLKSISNRNSYIFVLDSIIGLLIVNVYSENIEIFLNKMFCMTSSG